MFLSDMKMGVNIVFTLLFAGKYDWSINLVVKCKTKSCKAICAVSVTLPISSRDASLVTSLTFNDVSK